MDAISSSSKVTNDHHIHPHISLGKGMKRPTPLPTLDITILTHNGTFAPLQPNSIEPVAFETDFFRGHSQFFIRTPIVDPHVEPFFMGKRTFEIQVQGKFKRQPIGEIFLGGATTEKMELGILNRAICNTLVNFVSAMVPGAHFSFGDAEGKPNAEFPHAAGPLFATVDRLIISPPGTKPPKMGLPFEEDIEFRKIRLKSKSIKEFPIDLEAVYSFSQNTNNIDFPLWSFVGIPMVRTLDLRTILGDCPTRLISYEVPDAMRGQIGDKHPAFALNYVFCVPLARVQAGEGAQLVDIAPSDDDDIDYSIQTPDLSRLNSIDDVDLSDFEDHTDPIQSPRRGSKRFGKMFLSALTGKEKEGKEKEGKDDAVDVRVRAKSDVDDDDRPNIDPLGVGKWFRRHINPEAAEVTESFELMPIDAGMETDGDLRYCPACIETNDHRKEGRRRILFLIPWSTSTSQKNLDPNLDSGLSHIEPRIRSFTDFYKKLPLVPLPRNYRNKKMSAHEKQRRVIVESYKMMLSSGLHDMALNAFLNKLSSDDVRFLSDVPVAHVGKGMFSRGQEKWEGSCCLAMDRRHFVEAFLVVTSAEVSLTRTRDSMKRMLMLPIEVILTVSVMRPEQTPFQGFKYFCIETFARIYYFMVRSEKQLSAWIQAFTALLPAGAVNPTPEDELRLNEAAKQIPNDMSSYGEVRSSYYAKTPNWKLDKRRILNCRSIIFTSEGLPERLRECSPCELVESILDKAFKISQDESESVSQWISFMNDVSTLQTIDIYDISEVERVALYLNLYHIMILHGFLIFGPPTSWASYPSFVNSVTYIIAFDIVSIAELEHNIIRAAMSRPSPLLSKITAPNTQFPGLALTCRDFRFNFCLNNGSRSIQTPVPIYRPHSLDIQLDKTVSSFLDSSVVVDAQKKMVTLPKACSWFLSDFVTKKTLINGPVVGDCLRVIVHYLSGEAKSMLRRMLQEGPYPIVRFQPFTFRCIAFSRLEDSLANDIDQTSVHGVSLA